MKKNVLGILRREFGWFESKVNELERLKGILYSLDTQGFERDFAMIKWRLLNIGNIAEIERSIYNLKLRIREKKIKSAAKIADLIGSLFECYDNIDAWDYEKLKEEYGYILRRYGELSEEEKMFVYDIIDRLYNKIKEKNE